IIIQWNGASVLRLGNTLRFVKVISWRVTNRRPLDIMNWIYFALLAQLINAGVVLLDKFLLTSKSVARPLVYVFYVSMLSGTAFLLLPFKLIFPRQLVFWPTGPVIWLSLTIGLAFTLSIYFLYNALSSADASDVAPVVGAVSALATLLFSFLLLGGVLTGNFLLGFVFLTAGTALMSYFRFNRRIIGYVLLAGIFFALSAVTVKMLFNITSFWNGFFWSRLGNVAVALPLLLWPANRKIFRHNFQVSTLQTKFLVLASKFAAGIAFLLILTAISFGNVALVNALVGTQFIFLLLFALIFTKRFPGYFYETVHHHVAIIQKVLATLLIVAGYFLLFV
ncbi:MAG: DMT family transporter, partial [Candidatus Taylorbacteria bacterium]|nr:DMT family transporter [Candidatus Taylorbacteria bacterium]